MPIQSPIHSFVDFEDRITNFAIPAYKSQFAFQFLFSSDMDIARDSVLHIGGTVNGLSVFFLTNSTITDLCYWGKIAGLDFDADLPFTVATYQIIPAGEYASVQELLDALALVGFNTTNDTTFLQCCSENLQDYAIETDKGNITITFYRGVMFIQVDDNESIFDINNVLPGDCYRLAIDGGAAFSEYYISNLFKRVIDTTWLTFVSYGNNEDVYDFHYPDNSVVNALWLPVYQRRPRYPETRKVYMRSDKSYKTLSASIEKEWENLVEFMPDEFHDRMVVALSHDNIHFTSSKIDADVFKKGDYGIDWQDDDTLTHAQAEFTVNAQFEGRNSNCEQRPVCVALPDQPVPPECVAVGFDIDITMPPATVGEAYSHSIALTGTAPFTIEEVTNLPDGLMASIVDSDLVISGTPVNEGDGQAIIITVSNCDGDNSNELNTTIDIGESETPAIGIAPAANCRVTGTCNDNALCEVKFEISAANVPVGGYVELDNITGTASVGLTSSDPALAQLVYTEDNGFESVTFDLLLKDSGGAIIAAQTGIFINHQTYWQYFDVCE